MIRMYDVIVIGGGPAGLAAAAAAREEGAKVCLIERNTELGGILNQCIHDGFGLHAFGQVLTGPEFADRYARRVRKEEVEIRIDTLVVGLTAALELTCSTAGSRYRLSALAVVLSMGCRERTRAMLQIPGCRPAGVYTAGTAQHLINEANILPGRRVVILGSGDVGLIMARRLTWEGAEALAVIEKLPYPSGLQRNITQCLEDYDIPLYLSHTVIYVHGQDRVQGVTVASLDEEGKAIPGSEFLIECDTLLCSVGLIPENELSRRAGVKLDPCTGGAQVDAHNMTNVPGVFACGNVLHIHDLADWAAMEGEQAGRNAARYALGTLEPSSAKISITPGRGVRYVVPHFTSSDAEKLQLSLRVMEPGRDRVLSLFAGNRELFSKRLKRTHPAEMVKVEIPLSGSNLGRSLKVCMR